MKALTFLSPENIVYETVADPTIISNNDVIVDVSSCAICGSDLHVYFGRETGMDSHTAMGHEFCGEIVEVGSSVKLFKVGDHVMSPFSTSCGQCFYCKKGLTSRCVKSQLFGWVSHGKGLQGGQSEFARVPEADGTLMHIPEGVSEDEALLLGDILSTGFFCAKQAAISPRETQVVIGCGPVGLLTIIGAIEYGAQTLFAIDTVPERLAIAKQFGAKVINAKTEDAEKIIKDATDGRGADSVMEAVGNAGAMKLAYNLVRPGGIISAVGVCTDPHLWFSPTQAYDKNLTYKVGRCPARSMMEELIPLVQKKKYDFTSMISHRMPLSEGVKGYDIFANKKDNCLKVILTP